MRSDMKKVVAERSRYGNKPKQPKGYYKTLNHIPPEDHPKHESMTRKWRERWEGKHINVLTGPLLRYAHSVIGRDFDSVYSEIKKAMPETNPVVQMALASFWHFLERNVCFNEKGQPCHSENHFKWRNDFVYPPIYYHKYGPVAYVDPRDGMIKRAPDRPMQKRERKPRPYLWRDNRLYEKIDGIWYEISYEKYQTVREFCSVGSYMWSYYYNKETLIGGYDVVFKQNVRHLSQWQLRDQHGRSGIYAIAKRQINKRELKRLGLRK